ncbi:MAG: hypothetical protein M5R41_00840 [Bacteroidia bacterium]|nr:hypothetical protein [Bacteroidia bacterium]
MIVYHEIRQKQKRSGVETARLIASLTAANHPWEALRRVSLRTNNRVIHNIASWETRSNSYACFAIPINPMLMVTSVKAFGASGGPVV